MAGETAISVQTVSRTAGLDDITFSAGDQTNNHSWVNSGNEVLLMKSTNGSLAAIITSVANVNGRLGDITLTPGAGEISMSPLLSPALFNQRAAADLGKVIMTLADETLITFAVVKFV